MNASKFPEVGKVYVKKQGATSVGQAVRKVIEVTDEHVFYYDLLHKHRKGHRLRCRHKKFMKGKWLEIPEEKSYDKYKMPAEYVAEDYMALLPDGSLAFRCYRSTKERYVKRGYATEVDSHTIQLTEEAAQKRTKTLKEVFGDKVPSYIKEKKAHCVVCNAGKLLTKHHVMPEKIQVARKDISNILLLCTLCHEAYEEIKNKENVNFGNDPVAWQDHFIKTMKPKYLSENWNILCQQMKKE